MTHYITTDILTFKQLNTIISEHHQLELSEEAISKIEKSRQYLDQKMLDNQAPIYGINTGFGSLCHVKISDQHLGQLQKNDFAYDSLWHHASKCDVLHR
jgi:histidine ammonia-lyase